MSEKEIVKIYVVDTTVKKRNPTIVAAEVVERRNTVRIVHGPTGPFRYRTVYLKDEVYFTAVAAVKAAQEVNKRTIQFTRQRLSDLEQEKHALIELLQKEKVKAAKAKKETKRKAAKKAVKKGSKKGSKK